MGAAMESGASGPRLVVTPTAGCTLNVDKPEYALASNEFPIFKDLLVHQAGVWKRRGGADTWSDTALMSNAGYMASYTGTVRSGGLSGTYYGLDATNKKVYVQDGTGSAPYEVRQLATAAFGGRPMMVGDHLVVTNSNDGVLKFAGTHHEAYTGTATMAASTTVASISPSLTATQQSQFLGAYLTVTDDSTATIRSYQIRSVDSATQVTLESAYGGSAGAGAGKNIRISAVEAIRNTAGVMNATTSEVYASGASSAWNRLLLLGPYGNSAASDYVANSARVRWSGIVGSSEGTAPFYGIDAFDADGYMDLDPRGGPVLAHASYGSANLFFQPSKVTVVYGSPTFDGIGSIDASTTYDTGFTAMGSTYNVVSTPYGVFWVSAQRNIVRWSGSGHPVNLSLNRVQGYVENGSAPQLGYYRDYLFVMTNVQSNGSPQLVYHIPTDAWIEWSNSNNGFWAQMQPGWGTKNPFSTQYDQLVCLDSNRKVLDLTPTIDEPGTLTADQSGSTIRMDVQTGGVGSMIDQVRPEEAYLAYRLVDDAADNPYFKLTVTTGFPDASPDTAHTFESTSSQFNESSVIRAKCVSVDCDRGPQIQARIQQTNASTYGEIAGLVVECTAEGRVSS